jgi:tetratricopeptide (TPR) repeat protein
MAQRSDKARAILTQYDAEVRDTTVRRDFEPLRHRALAEIAIAEHRPSDAVNEIRAGDRRIDGPADVCAACTYAALGRAFDLADMPDSAITNFEAFLATPQQAPSSNVLTGDPRHLAGAYKRLGELYDAKGDRQRAALYYTKFVELWKNADPELQPKVTEVKRRLARLNEAEAKR